MSKRALPGAEREALFRQMGTLVQETWDGETSAGEGAAEKARFEAAVVFGARRRALSRGRRVLVAALVAGAVLTALVVFWPAPLGYVVAASSSNEGGYLQAGSAAPATARFTDGTAVDVAQGGRARIVETDRHGARIALEHGRATLRVVHRPGARWSVEAGPFSIAVTGTEFDADWSGADERLVVELRQGSVVVRGSVASGGVALAAGQRLVASVRDGKIRIEPLVAPPAPSDAPRASTTAGDETVPVPAREEPAPAPAASSLAIPGASWNQLVRAGDFAGVLRDAEARGLSGTLRSASESDLVALADAARYTGKSDVAESALLAVQKRFPASADGRAAAFLLGRLAEGRGARGEAIALYDRYLAESPRGSFAAEALGRKMLAVESQGGVAEARTIAEQYLVRFPKGAYADAARKLAPSP